MLKTTSIPVDLTKDLNGEYTALERVKEKTAKGKEYLAWHVRHNGELLYLQHEGALPQPSEVKSYYLMKVNENTGNTVLKFSWK